MDIDILDRIGRIQRLFHQPRWSVYYEDVGSIGFTGPDGARFSFNWQDKALPDYCYFAYRRGDDPTFSFVVPINIALFLSTNNIIVDIHPSRFRIASHKLLTWIEELARITPNIRIVDND